MKHTHILVIEDDPSILEIIKYHLQKNKHWQVHTATDGQTGVDMADALDPDLIIVDWMLPHKSGIEVIQHMRKNTDRHIPIIMLTARGEEQDKIQSLSTGADDYVVKPFSPRELDARIKASLRRDKHTDYIVSRGDISVNLQQKAVYENAVPVKLGRKEYEILVLLLKTPNRILSREKILNKVWGLYADVDDRTIDVHVTRLRKKFKNAKRIESVWGEGYRFVDK